MQRIVLGKRTYTYTGSILGAFDNTTEAYTELLLLLKRPCLDLYQTKWTLYLITAITVLIHLSFWFFFQMKNIYPLPCLLQNVYCYLPTIVSKWPAVHTGGDFQSALLSGHESLSWSCLLSHVAVDKTASSKRARSRCHGLRELISCLKYVSWLKIAHLGGEMRAIL